MGKESVKTKGDRHGGGVVELKLKNDGCGVVCEGWYISKCLSGEETRFLAKGKDLVGWW